MFQLTFMTLSSLASILFTQISHPLAMTFLILGQTILFCLLSGMTTQTFWFSYILFLVFLGGMLVLFIYITSLASNEMFTIPMKMVPLILMILTTTIIIYTIMDSSMWSLMFNNSDMLNKINLSSVTHAETPLPLTKLYNKPTDLVTLMMVLYLFLTLIAVVKITNIFQGPLRPKT
uniref:NADH-ubiquinone oxidoreductase chain 6 n=1 Tax=Tarragoilus diuturnus TaxID=1258561 RepID=M9P1A5_9ORTH|nr:NADH dehydrogenase subunit 6 [Tarragoilus diuturnus]AFW98791.1 NADH dehydrogenase subunit 6 [Tarragoilus diuturnus]